MEINNYFDAPFGVCPTLRLQNIRRWGIISMSKQQSVAEHGFNVAMITKWILSRIDHRTHSITIGPQEIILLALEHDADELWTGDIPTPAKETGKSTQKLLHWVIKLADNIESLRYAVQYCNDTKEVREWVIKGLEDKVSKILDDNDLNWDLIAPLIEEVE